MDRRRILQLAGLLVLGGLLAASTAPVGAAATVSPNQTDAAADTVTNVSDEADDRAASAVNESAATVQASEERTATARSAGQSTIDHGPTDRGKTAGPTKRDTQESENVTVAGHAVDETTSNLSVGGVSDAGPDVRIFDVVPESDFDVVRVADDVVPGSTTDGERVAVRNTPSAREQQSTRRDDASIDDPAENATTAAIARSDDGHARFDAPATTQPHPDGSAGPVGSETAGVGLAVILVGFLGAGLPGCPTVLLVETAGSLVRDELGGFVDRRFPVVPIGRYSRYDDSDPLENDIRAAVYETVTESPGIYYARIADETGVTDETVRYHARILAEEGLIERRDVRGRKRLYPVQADDDVRAAAALAEPATSNVLEAIRRHEPATLSKLADAVDRAPSTMSHHLDRLEDDGLVTRERTAEGLQVRLRASARSALDRNATAD